MILKTALSCTVAYLSYLCAFCKVDHRQLVGLWHLSPLKRHPRVFSKAFSPPSFQLSHFFAPEKRLLSTQTLEKRQFSKFPRQTLGVTSFACLLVLSRVFTGNYDLFRKFLRSTFTLGSVVSGGQRTALSLPTVLSSRLNQNNKHV